MGGGGIWAKYVNDFKARVIADGGTMESPSCAKSDVKFLVQNPEPVSFTGLLNDYSGAAAAYSLRLLDNTYSGSAVRVRRASDNAEQDIAFANNELDTATLESFASGTDAFVTTWYDQSGNGNDATQGTASAQPKIVSSGSTLLRGGKPSMQFDGVNDNFITSQNNPFTFTGGVSMIHASYKNATSYKNFETILSAGTTGNGSLNGKNSMALGYGNGSYPSPKPTIVTDIWSPSGIQYDGTIGTNERHLIGFYISNWSTHLSTGLSNLRLNGNDLITKSYRDVIPNLLRTEPIKIGVYDEILTTSFFAGEIQEIIAYASDKNSDRVGIETNINDFYSIY